MISYNRPLMSHPQQVSQFASDPPLSSSRLQFNQALPHPYPLEHQLLFPLQSLSRRPSSPCLANLRRIRPFRSAESVNLDGAVFGAGR